MGRGQRLGLVVAAAIVAAIAFVVLRPDDGDDGATQQRTTEETRPEDTTAAPKPKPEQRFETIVIARGTVRGGAREITVEKGDTARIEVRSDAPDEIHLHGYDLYRDVRPGRPARFVLEAENEGIFELEAHDLGHVVVGELVVEP